MGAGDVDELPELEGGASQLDVVQRWLDTSDDAHFAKVVLRWLEETSAELLDPSYAVDCSWPQTTRYVTCHSWSRVVQSFVVSRFNVYVDTFNASCLCLHWFAFVSFIGFC